MLSVNEIRKRPRRDGGGAGLPQGEDYRLPWQVYELLLLVIVGGG